MRRPRQRGAGQQRATTDNSARSQSFSSRVTCEERLSTAAIGSRTEPTSCIQQAAAQQAVQPSSGSHGQARIEFPSHVDERQADLATAATSLRSCAGARQCPARRKRPVAASSAAASEPHARRTPHAPDVAAREASAHQGKASLRAISASTRDSSENGARRRHLTKPALHLALSASLMAALDALRLSTGTRRLGRARCRF